MLTANVVNALAITGRRLLEGLFSALSQENKLRPNAIIRYGRTLGDHKPDIVHSSVASVREIEKSLYSAAMTLVDITRHNTHASDTCRRHLRIKGLGLTAMLCNCSHTSCTLLRNRMQNHRAAFQLVTAKPRQLALYNVSL